MLTRSGRLPLILLVVFGAVMAANAQCPLMPPGFLCITQAAGNQAAANARELAVKDEKIRVLEAGLVAKDKNTEEIKATAAKNEKDLIDRLHKTEVEFARVTGQLIEKEKQVVFVTATNEALMKLVKRRCVLAFCVN